MINLRLMDKHQNLCLKTAVTVNKNPTENTCKDLDRA